MRSQVQGQSAAYPARRLRLCLAGSGGGHIRQLLDLEGAWASHDVFFVTDDTALGRSVAEKHRTHFVAHVALGQARLGAPLKMIWNGLRNFFQSARAILAERPDAVISTGAGTVFFAVLWARLFGAKLIIIDSFARFERPSVFARVTAPLATRKVVQSKALARYWPDAEVFDPLRILEAPRPPKQELVFATVGATLPFDRLVSSVARLKERGLIPERLLVQTGVGGHKPLGIEAVETLTFDEIQQLLKEADIVICHGGTGSIITALKEGCRVISMPRLFELGEGYDGHQAEITDAFAKRGLIASANSEEELETALLEVRERTPVLATTDPVALRDYLKQFLDSLAPRRIV